MKTEKVEVEDTVDSGGILLKSNTEAPGEEVVKATPAATPSRLPRLCLFLISAAVLPGFQPHHPCPLWRRLWS